MSFRYIVVIALLAIVTLQIYALPTLAYAKKLPSPREEALLGVKIVELTYLI